MSGLWLRSRFYIYTVSGDDSDMNGNRNGNGNNGASTVEREDWASREAAYNVELTAGLLALLTRLRVGCAWSRSI